MSVKELIIEKRSRDIGAFLVGRILPFRKKRMVGPFIFIDHMGPSEVGPEKYLDVDQHPHIGLSTLTYLIDGEIIHKDSIGTEQRITPGSVNWMTAGKGVTHTERTPEDLRDKTSTINGYQIWIALPNAFEDLEPSFHHVSKDKLPVWKENEAEFRLIAGEAFGKKSPVPVHSHLFMVEMKNKKEIRIDLSVQLKGEIGILISEGSLIASDQKIDKEQMLVSKTKETCHVILQPSSHVFLFGGEPLEGERYIDWNFVASSKEKIEIAKTRWKNKAFPKIPDDNTYVPLPLQK